MSQISLFPVTSTGSTDRLVKLRDVERILADSFHRESRPSRNTIIGWIEEGILLGTQVGRGHNYYVFESSLATFRERLNSESMSIAA